mmetsp:Transcript_11250/g.30613  ORF Transcript_11250/g.30613 Transcript_11250/m.30613 type:complete len:120 (-) Transcript_11250:95-454(-)
MQSPLRACTTALALACLAACADGAFRGRDASLAHDDPAAEKSDGKASVVDEKAFEEDWGSEWRNGDFPSFRKTVKAEDYDHKAFEDSQSDGKPSAGLTGSKVGAYLPHPLPQDYPKGGE